MTTTSAKAVNYTAQQVEVLVEGYKAGESIEVLAEKIGKSVRSAVAKLSREGVYVAKAKTAAEGRVTKADLIEKIAAKFGVESEKLDSLEKATKEALQLLAEGE
jgi:hypothetical protein